MNYLFSFLFVALCLHLSAANDCGKGFDRAEVLIHPDRRIDETSWSLRNYYTGELYDSAGGGKGDTLCVPSEACLKFTIYDAYGDGICCGQGNGWYRLLVNGKEVTSGGNFNFQDVSVIHCREGLYCSSPIAACKGVQTAPFRDSWYTFITDSTGIWEISTCNLGNKCDTRLYTYARCHGITYFDGNVGTQFYNDNSADCDNLQAKINGFVKKGDTLLIRIGDKDTSCSGKIIWKLQFKGPVQGCMDSNACNYKPQATLSDNSCLYPPAAVCPLPDLKVDEAEVYRSLRLDTVNAGPGDCLLAEGCLRRAGHRLVLRFSTRITNIGEADFVLGDASGDPSLFIQDPCHGHWHYKEFIQYSLSNAENKTILVAHKDGFCISDMECPKGVIGPYGCNFMGITPGCSDVYDATVPCQWIDISGMDTGNYQLNVMVNWRKEPDKLGHVEHSFENNLAVVHFRLEADKNGRLTLKQMLPLK